MGAPQAPWNYVYIHTCAHVQGRMPGELIIDSKFRSVHLAKN